MRQREEYEELALFPHLRDWAEEGAFGPMLTLLAVMGTTLTGMQRVLKHVQPSLQAMASDVPPSVRVRCYEEPRWVFQEYIRGMAHAGLPGLAGFALILASGIRIMPVRMALALARGERRADGQPWSYVPEPEDWRSRDVVAVLSESIDDLQTIAAVWRRSDNRRARSPQAGLLLHNYGRYVLRYVAEVAAFLTGRIFVAPTLAAMARSAIPSVAPPTPASPACVDFVSSVMIPMILAYQEHPHTVYRRACGGDEASLRMLVAIDPSALQFPQFESMLVRARSGTARQWLCDLLAERPIDDVSPRDIKLQIVGGLVARARDLGVRMTRPDIQRLFNAMARETSHGAQRLDPDIGDMNEERLRKAVERA